jgi:hypothetical protein
MTNMEVPAVLTKNFDLLRVWTETTFTSCLGGTPLLEHDTSPKCERCERLAATIDKLRDAIANHCGMMRDNEYLDAWEDEE